MTDRQRPRLWRAALAAVSTLAGLAIAEAVARLTYGPGFLSVVDRYEHHPYRPYAEYVDWAGIRVSTNSLGWKDRSPREIAPDPSPRRRVVLLGDSFTEGQGLPAEATAGSFAEAELNRDGERFEVLNGGRISYSPLLEYQRLKRFLAHGYRADTVVLLPDMSDVQDEIEYSSQYEFSADGEPLRLRGTDYLPAVRWLYNHFALARWLRRGQLRLQGRLSVPEVAHAGEEVVLPPGERAFLRRSEILPTSVYRELPPASKAILRHAWVDHPPSLDGWARDGLERMGARIARIEELAERHRMRLIVVIYPWPQVLHTREDPARYAFLAKTFPRWFGERATILGRGPSGGAVLYRETMARACRERSIPFVDLFPAFQRRRDWHRLFLEGDVHWSAEGSRLVGREIAAAVLRGGGPSPR